MPKDKAAAATPPKKPLEQKIAEQRERDAGQSPLLRTFKSLEQRHGAKELEKAFKQWREDEYPDDEQGK